jgi:hypothetical protein
MIDDKVFPGISSAHEPVERLATSGFGTKRTSSDVRSSVAIGGKADMTRTAHFGRKGPRLCENGLDDMILQRFGRRIR